MKQNNLKIWDRIIRDTKSYIKFLEEKSEKVERMEVQNKKFFGV